MGRVVMPPIQATAEPAKAALPATPDGEQPPAAAAQSTGLKPVTVAARDERSKEEQARALLQGEPPKEAAPDESENASIDAHFDPETDELLEAEHGTPADVTERVLLLSDPPPIPLPQGSEAEREDPGEKDPEG